MRKNKIGNSVGPVSTIEHTILVLGNGFFKFIVYVWQALVLGTLKKLSYKSSTDINSSNKLNACCLSSYPMELIGSLIPVLILGLYTQVALHMYTSTTLVGTFNNC
jgi:hypothetical protein